MNYSLYLITFCLTSCLVSHLTNATKRNKTGVRKKGKVRTHGKQVRSKLHGKTNDTKKHIRRQNLDVVAAYNEDDEQPSAERGPERGPHYDPSFGHEPYWIDGLWVLSTYSIPPPDIVEQLQDFNCGLKCGSFYKLYGRICARNRFFVYRSFANYCGMKSIDCSGLEEWRVIYKGYCRERFVHYRNNIVSKVSFHINRFISDYTFTEKFIGYPFRTKRTLGPDDLRRAAKVAVNVTTTPKSF